MNIINRKIRKSFRLIHDLTDIYIYIDIYIMNHRFNIIVLNIDN